MSSGIIPPFTASPNVSATLMTSSRSLNTSRWRPRPLPSGRLGRPPNQVLAAPRLLNKSSTGSSPSWASAFKKLHNLLINFLEVKLTSSILISWRISSFFNLTLIAILLISFVMWKEYPQYYEFSLWTDFGVFLLLLIVSSYLAWRAAKWHDDKFL